MNAASLFVLALAFAFPDEQGVRLLATGAIAKPEALRVALCTGNQPLAVQFDRMQVEGPNTTGRQTPKNFSQSAGAVFRIVGGKVGADVTCALADESFLADATLVPLKRPPPDARCPRAMYPDFQRDKGRPVVGCWPIGASAAGGQIAVIEFSRHLTQALASLVVVDGARRMYVDYPATFTGPGDDLWRADDGGNIHAEGFDVIFLLKRGNTYLLAMDWAGAEGSALSFYVADDSNQFKEVLNDSWYRSPL